MMPLERMSLYKNAFRNEEFQLQVWEKVLLGTASYENIVICHQFYYIYVNFLLVCINYQSKYIDKLIALSVLPIQQMHIIYCKTNKLYLVPNILTIVVHGL